jgi:hypothetical protein
MPDQGNRENSCSWPEHIGRFTKIPEIISGAVLWKRTDKLVRRMWCSSYNISVKR